MTLWGICLKVEEEGICLGLAILVLILVYLLLLIKTWKEVILLNLSWHIEGLAVYRLRLNTWEWLTLNIEWLLGSGLFLSMQFLLHKTKCILLIRFRLRWKSCLICKSVSKRVTYYLLLLWLLIRKSRT